MPDISIIVPTLNEADNLPMLARRIAAALPDASYEIVVVDDDSRDDTKGVCAELARSHPLRLLTRVGAGDGLGGAVLHGIAQSTGGTIVVMDADLQHPPETIPQLLATLDGGAEFALGSRYVAGGTTSTHFSPFRRLNSGLATLLARPFAGDIRDPMSGFFALRRSTFARGRRLAPLGYKIGLELICKCRVASVVEVPIHFARRHAGQSKLSLKEQFRYLEHLSRLYDFSFPRLSSYAKFLIVLALAWAVGLALTNLFTSPPFSLPVPRAVTLAYLGNVLVTAAFHLRYVRVQRQFLVVPRPWVAFWVTTAAELASCAASAWWLTRHLIDPTPLLILFLSFALGTVVRYIMRKELGQDLRGLRYEPRAGELT